MAVRFDADGEDYTSTSTAITSPFTVMCWGMVSSDRNAFSTFVALDDSVGTNSLLLQTDADGVTLQVYSDPAEESFTGAAMTVGTWYRMAVVFVAGSATTLYQGAAGAALSTTTLTFSSSPTGLTVTRLGESLFTEWLNGRLANVKVYTAALTAAEVASELAQYAPVRTANLFRWHPLLAPDTADYSGLGRTLTLTGGAPTREDGPPIPWEAVPVGVVLPAVGPPTTVSAGNAAATAAVPTVPHGVAVSQPRGPAYPGGFPGQHPDTGDDPFTVTAAVGAASNATVNVGRTVLPTVAAATGAAANVTPLVSTNGGVAAGTGAVNQPAVDVKTAAGQAAGTGAANNAVGHPAVVSLAEAVAAAAAAGNAAAGQSSVAPAEAAEATGAASSAAPKVGAAAGLAGATGQALLAPTSLRTTVEVEPGLAVGATGAATAGVTPPAGGGVATGQAADVTPRVAAVAGGAAATGEAPTGTAGVRPPAGLAGGTGSAGQAAASIPLAPTQIAVTAASAGAGPVVTARPAAASATGEAPNPGIPAFPPAAAGVAAAGAATAGAGARAQPATAAAAAHLPVIEAINIGPAEPAGGDGAALNPEVLVRPRGVGHWGSLLRVLDQMTYERARVQPVPDNLPGWGQ